MAETLITLYEEYKIEMKNRYTKYSNTYKTQNKLTKPQSSFCSNFTSIPPKENIYCYCSISLITPLATLA